MPLCPYCGRDNQRWGMEDKAPGERFSVAPNPCEHFVFWSIENAPSGADYVHSVLYFDVYNVRNPKGKPGVEISAEVIGILRKHFQFADGTGFAESDAARRAARTEVCGYLHSLGYSVPECGKTASGSRLPHEA